jgi:tRNA-2-methylthio-N6-dimethylallyladenosine synthase
MTAAPSPDAFAAPHRGPRLPATGVRTFFIHTFGCQMNVHDSDRMHAMLCDAGFVPARDAAHADLVVVNTCSVREKAEQKLDSALGKLRRLKARRRFPPVVAVTGCVASQRGNGLLTHMPFVDIALGPDNLHELPALALAAASGAPRSARTGLDPASCEFLALPRGARPPGPSAFVSISKGCDERCSFCIVPQVRGPERHRAAGEVAAEVARLVEAGALQVVLLGQTVNGYRDPAAELASVQVERGGERARSDFPALLRLLSRQVPGLARLRYASPHPRYFGSELARAHRDLEVLCRHVHMPVQSGSDAVLRRMVRRHTRAEYLESVAALREARPDLTVSTDIIVGFPGETDADFEATLALMREARFSGVYGFKYSPRPGTPALRLGDDVPEPVKSARLAAVFRLSDELQAEQLSRLVGSVQHVLLEEMSPRGDGRLSGRTERNEIVHLAPEGGLDLGSGIVPVRITRAFRHSLEGRWVGPRPPARESPPRRTVRLPLHGRGA